MLKARLEHFALHKLFIQLRLHKHLHRIAELLLWNETGEQRRTLIRPIPCLRAHHACTM